MIHPAIRQLLHVQRVAKLRRFGRSFSSPRRLFLSLLGLVLAAVWIGNVVLSVALRQSTPPDEFARLVPIGLMVYAFWHIMKTAFKRPELAIEWAPAEQELICAGPFSRRDAVVYRIVGILHATIVKAACFTLLMGPDLPCVVAGFVGALLALVFLDLGRFAVEIAAHGISARQYGWFRATTAVIVAGIILATLVIGISAPAGWRDEQELFPLSVGRHFLLASSTLLDTPVGQAALWPFQWFGKVITTEAYDVRWAGLTAACLTVVVLLAGGVVRGEARFAATSVRREQLAYPPQASTDARTTTHLAVRRPRRRIAWLAGVGPVAWRQLLGASQQRSQLAVALALPGLLALLPVSFCRTGQQALFHVSAALTFYSFLLLPTALKFDFRRDILRMAVLKTLPIRPVALVIGQIVAPTLLSLLFQATVLGITMCFRPYPSWMLVATLTVLGPLNALIFAIDNLVYLLYPYRLNQEGLEIFLRTTLTFTAKGLIFAVGLLVTFLWSFTARQLADALPSGLNDPAVIFVAGCALMLAMGTWLAILMLSRAYQRFDPSQDVPV